MSVDISSRLKSLNELGCQLAPVDSIEQVLTLTVRGVLYGSGAQFAILYLFDHEGKPTAQLGYDAAGNRISTDAFVTLKTIARQIQLSNEAIVISESESAFHAGLAGFKSGESLKVFAGSPLKRGNSPVAGILGLGYTSLYPFSQSDLEILNLFALLASSAIDSVHLLEENRRRELDLGIIVDNAHLMISTLDLEELIQQIAIRLAWVTGMNSCAISSYHRHSDRLRLLAQYTVLGEKIREDGGWEYCLSEHPLRRLVFESNEPQLVYSDDPKADPAEAGYLKNRGDKTLLLLPLKAGGEPVGMLELYSNRANYTISMSDIKRLKALSEQVALALVNARHYRDEQRARLTAETLRQATAALTSTLEVNQVLDLILEQFQQVVHYDSASLMLVEGNLIRVVAVRGHPESKEALKSVTELSGHFLASEVIVEQKSIIIPDVQNDSRYLAPGAQKHVRGWMGVPLISRGEVIGMLAVDNDKANVYSESDAKIALTFAGQAALAVTNARLYQSEHEHRTIAEVLGEISVALLTSSLDSSAVLEILLEQIKRVVPYDTGCIMMIEGVHAGIKYHLGFEKYGIDRLEDVILSVPDTPNLDKIANTFRPHFIPDVKADPFWQELECSKHIGSWVGAPLVSRERLLGFLSLDKVERNFYNAEHAANLAILAGHASLALISAYTFKEVEEASITDFLTSSYNHRYFQQQLRHEMDRATRLSQPLSLLMIDLDYFKKVNDAYGHLTGDQVLRTIAARLKGELRAYDILSRYGGEEFALILPGTSAASAYNVAERLRESIAQSPIRISDNDVRVTISIGVSSFPSQAKDPKELLNLADQALYRSKNGGRNRVSVHDG